MANYNNIKNVIRNNIYNNSKQEISGDRLRDVLLAMVNALSAEGYVFKGIMSSTTPAPATPDGREFYFSSDAGQYAVGVTIGDEFAIIKYDTAWSKESLNVLTKAHDLVFVTTYQVTPYADILAAYNAGKIVACKKDDRVFVLSRITGGVAYFSNLWQATNLRLACNSSNLWSVNSYEFEQKSNMSQTNVDDPKKYPSCSLLHAIYADIVDGLATKANISSVYKKSQVDAAISAEALARGNADTALGQRIDNISGVGIFLSGWDCTTGLPEDNPSESPYEYKEGNYFLVSKVGTTNYKPSGNQYVIGQASTAVESGSVKVGDVYKYSTNSWVLIQLADRIVNFLNIAGSPYDNTALATALNAKANLADVYTKVAADALLALKANSADVYTKTAADALLAAKASVSDLNTLGGRVTTIEGKIPAQATSANQLADKAFVTSALTPYRTSAAQDIIDAGKQDTISDLATIRSGAEAGASALQPAALTPYRTSANQDTIDAGKEAIANKTSDIAGNTTSTTKYATTKGVADYVTAIVGSIGTILDEINGEEI